MSAPVAKIPVTVCDACGSDMCWQGQALCEKSRSAGTIEVPACRHVNDLDGRQCLRLSAFIRRDGRMLFSEKRAE